MRRRRAFAITETELSLIAAPAIIGLGSVPNTGYSTPAANDSGSWGYHIILLFARAEVRDGPERNAHFLKRSPTTAMSKTMIAIPTTAQTRIPP
ncbi:MAG: hypothetical protein H0X38_11060 [Planctomycetes bacterium]|nr:hypothetical protein [Planctomycetota bacterium]